MSQAEALLDILPDEGQTEVAAYSVESEEGHIVIGANRFITVPEKLRRLGVAGDHNIETVTFDCPRYWDEHDLSTMAIYINYICANGKVGAYVADNVRANDSDDSMIHFDWTISKNVTQARGAIIFLVCAKQTDDNGESTLRWHSERCSQAYISEGLDAVEAVMDSDPDLLTQVLLLADKIGEGGGGGADVFSPIAKVVQTDAGAEITMTDKTGTTTATIKHGDDGKTPVKRVDYFTEADKTEIANEAASLVSVKIDSEILSAKLAEVLK